MPRDVQGSRQFKTESERRAQGPERNPTGSSDKGQLQRERERKREQFWWNEVKDM